MPFQPGNKLAASRKPFRDALRLEITAAGEDHRALREVARKLLDMARDGDMQAIKELADRVDGRVTQPIGGDDDAPPIKVSRIELVALDGNTPDRTTT
jgi:hypothetical protein